MVFRKLTEKDHKRIIEFLMEEPEFNLFIIGDIENYGYEQDFQTVWGMVDDKRVDGVLLKYYNTFLPYSYNKRVLEKFSYLISLGAHVISGKSEIIDLLKIYLERERIGEEKREYLARLSNLKGSFSINANYRLKKAKIEDIDRLLQFREKIEEFQSIPQNKNAIINKLKTGSGRIYYIENEEGLIVSKAATSAENSFSAMVVGVATLPEYRYQGLASYCVHRICNDLIGEGKTPVLFYDNPEAGKIYEKIGFENIGNWSILKLT